jgi:hypothetical protein
MLPRDAADDEQQLSDGNGSLPVDRVGAAIIWQDSIRTIGVDGHSVIKANLANFSEATRLR